MSNLSQSIEERAKGGSRAPEIARLVAEVLRRERAQLHEPEFAGNEWAYVKECIDTGWVSSVGKMVDRFEGLLCEVTGVKHAVAVVNGTAALHVCTLLSGVRSGDEVIIPSLTFVATANALRYAGAVPHFADVEIESLGLDAEKVDCHLRATASRESSGLMNHRTGRRIAGLVVMHAFGHPANLEALSGVADRYGIPLIEDAAESLGSSYRGRQTGSFGLLSAISFNGNKIVTTGGGGVILTNDASLARRAKHLTTTARVPAGWNFVHDEVGFNYRLPNINAALGCAQIERLDNFLNRKRSLAARYRKAFAGLEGVSFVDEPRGARSNFWLNNILVQGGVAERDAALERLNELGYVSRPAWMPMHMLHMFKDCPRSDLSVTEDVFSRLVSLPSSACLGDAT